MDMVKDMSRAGLRTIITLHQIYKKHTDFKKDPGSKHLKRLNATLYVHFMVNDSYLQDSQLIVHPVITFKHN